jgi:hypothetical protein
MFINIKSTLMTKSIRVLLLTSCAFFLISTLSNCSKEGGSTPATKTATLSAKAWKIEKSGVDADKNGTIDLLDTQQACQLDNTFLFKTDGTGTFDEGASKCKMDDPQSGAFAWTFKSNETILSAVIAALGFSGDATISMLNDTTLEVYQDVTIAGTLVRYVIRFKH